MGSRAGPRANGTVCMSYVGVYIVSVGHRGTMVTQTIIGMQVMRSDN